MDVYVEEKWQDIVLLAYTQAIENVLESNETDFPDGHDAIAVLDEMLGGFYSIVLPGSNEILRYDPQTEWYEFLKGWIFK